jgi:gluconokinase
MWFARHEPELCARVRWWVGLKEYLLLALSGTLATELSSASGTGLLDLAARDWHADAIALAGITREQLPPILATTAVLPLGLRAAARTGLPAGTPVVTGAADGPLGNLGTGAMSPGVAGLSLGTSGALRVVVPEPRVDAERGLFCYALTENAWVVGGAVSNGGAVVRWAGDVFGRDLRSADGGPPPDAALLELAGQIPAGSDGLVMLPYLLPERSPSSDPELTGAFLGIRHSHTRGHFVRAAVEGVAQQLGAILRQVDGVTPVSSVRATGGALRSPLWREVLADALGRPLSVTGEAEGTALGAAGLALFATGRAPSPEAGVRLVQAVSAAA